MQREEITEIFDQQASSYDQKWSKVASISSALHLLASTVLSELPSDARILCVGSGTGLEILYLASKFLGWHFTAVEPSTEMLDVFRSRAEDRGILSRCTFHRGYLETLPSSESFDAAIAFLVSQFIQERKKRSEFFQSIADRLCPDGFLVSSDLAGDLNAPDRRGLLELWYRLTNADDFSPEGVERMRRAYTQDVAVLKPQEVSDIIELGGFKTPVPFYQAGLIHAWYAKRLSLKAELGSHLR